MTVEALWLQIRCLRRATEAEREENGERYATCQGFWIDGEPVEHGRLLEMPAHAPDLVRLGPHRIRFAESRGGHLCIALRAIFRQVGPRHDHSLYTDPGDRYSLLSWCTVEQLPDWAPAPYPFEQNRVETADAFRERLSRPIVLELRPGAEIPPPGSARGKGGAGWVEEPRPGPGRGRVRAVRGTPTCRAAARGHG